MIGKIPRLCLAQISIHTQPQPVVGQPAGYYYGSYNDFGRTAYFWSATGYSSSNAYLRSLYYGNAYVHRYGSSKTDGRSVRCVRD